MTPRWSVFRPPLTPNGDRGGHRQDRAPFGDPGVRRTELQDKRGTESSDRQGVRPARIIVEEPAKIVDVDHQALLCTDPAVVPVQIVEWFVLRWQVEVTPYPVRGRLFQEARAHLGVETQHQWSDRAIARTIPLLLGLFSWITLAAHVLGGRRLATTRSTAWYAKAEPTFVDAIALVRVTSGLLLRLSACRRRDLDFVHSSRMTDGVEHPTV